MTSTFAAGVWTASGAITDVNTLLAGVTFNPSLNYNSDFTIATSVDDGLAAAVTGTRLMTGTAVNDAPVLGAIGNQTVDDLSTLSFTATATDVDLSDTLTFSLDAASTAAGMSINANTGAFSWTPESQGGTTPSVTITVTDSGTGSKIDSKTFSIDVAALPEDTFSPPEVIDIDEPIDFIDPDPIVEQPDTSPELLEEIIDQEPELSDIPGGDYQLGEAFSNIDGLINELLVDAESELVNNQKSNIASEQTGVHSSSFDKNTIDKTGNLQDLFRLQAMQDQLSNEARMSLFDNSYDEIDSEEEHKLWSRIDQMREQMDDDLTQEFEDNVEVKVVLGTSASLTAGFVGWVLRGGSLLASMMSTLPVLNRFDPLPVLMKNNKDKIDHHEDKVSTEDCSEAEVEVEAKKKLDNIFSQQAKKYK